MAAIKGSLNVKLSNYPPANAGALVKLTNPSTGQVIERKPFLDGSLVVRDIDPGEWQVQVLHPNVTLPLFAKPIRVLPQRLPTFVPVPIDPIDFRDTPIVDVPDANLAPVQQAASAVRTQASAVGGKGAGEVIRAEDWNQLVGAVTDLAGAVLELASLVSPRGHDHPEIATKIDEVQGNLRRFVTAFGQSLLELRRDIENENLRRYTVDMLDVGGVVGPARDRIIGRVAELETSLYATPVEFSAKMAATGTVLAAEVNEIAVGKGAEAAEFLATPQVQKVLTLSQSLAASGGQITAEEELGTYRRTGVALGGSKVGFLR
ncbi:hypothetical protein EXU48_12785 [Occultella glacieicola]|uniref:Uncharacterized protein n=1 Tax=Occultella glacieicola TaxID=2518684 RepID=A0ABY2E1G8_9MICO|nr:hypothetical protein [Occultella glacieicola]TDE92440.1 hypothetical protein EXU48_12785 [Occultella glacieicola]